MTTDTRVGAVEAVRAAVGEHVPDSLKPRLAELVAELRARREASATALRKHDLADALAAAEASLNGTLDGENFEALLIEVQSQPAQIGRLASDLLKTTSAEPDWIIPKVAAKGWMVKVAGREKVGKGKLIFTTLGALERGEATVFGPATKPIGSVIFTEEPEDSAREKVAQARLDRALIVYGWELAGMDWHSKVDALVNAADGYGVLFVDNISRAAGVEDEAGVELARAAEYLGDKSRQTGLTTLIDHHHRKGAGKLDDKSRGGTALAGACDNNLEIMGGVGEGVLTPTSCQSKRRCDRDHLEGHPFRHRAEY